MAARTKYPAIAYPADNTILSINSPISIARDWHGPELTKSHVYVFGRVGTGTSVMMRNILAGVTRCQDTVVWVIDPERVIVPSGKTRSGSRIAWLISDDNEAFTALINASHILKERKQNVDLDQVTHLVIFLDVKTRNRLMKHENFRDAYQYLLAHGTDLRVHLVLEGKDPAREGMNLRNHGADGPHFGNRIGMCPMWEDEFLAGFGEEKPEAGYLDQFPLQPGFGMLRTPSSNEIRPFQAYLVTDSDIEYKQPNPTPELEGFTMAVTSTLPTPTDLSTMTAAQIASQLRTQAGSTENYAAVDLLSAAFGGKLLNLPDIRKALTLDDGRIYVNWKHIEQAANTAASAWGKYPSGSQHVLRIAVGLAGGEIIPSVARELAGTLAVVGRVERPTMRTDS